MQTEQVLQHAANRLKNNPLLTQILAKRETDLIQLWRGSATIEKREQTWQALRELDILSGAITDAVKKYSSNK